MSRKSGWGHLLRYPRLLKVSVVILLIVDAELAIRLLTGNSQGNTLFSMLSLYAALSSDKSRSIKAKQCDIVGPK